MLATGVSTQPIEMFTWLHLNHLDQLNSRRGKVEGLSGLHALHDGEPLAPRAIVAGDRNPVRENNK